MSVASQTAQHPSSPRSFFLTLLWISAIVSPLVIFVSFIDFFMHVEGIVILLALGLLFGLAILAVARRARASGFMTLTHLIGAAAIALINLSGLQLWLFLGPPPSDNFASLAVFCAVAARLEISALSWVFGNGAAATPAIHRLPLASNLPDVPVR